MTDLTNQSESQETTSTKTVVEAKHLDLAQRIAKLANSVAVDVEKVFAVLETEVQKAWDALTDEQKAAATAAAAPAEETGNAESSGAGSTTETASNSESNNTAQEGTAANTSASDSATEGQNTGGATGTGSGDVAEKAAE